MSDPFEPPPAIKLLHRVRWFHRALVGLLFAPVAMLIGLGILYVVEQSAAQHALALDSGQRQLQRAKAAIIDPKLEGKLVHVSGPITIAQPVKDPHFEIAAEAVKLDRVVEMLQWVEFENPDVDARRQIPFVYRTEWQREVIESTKFWSPEDHQNPHHLPYHTSIFANPTARLGAHMPASYQIEQLETTAMRPISPAEFAVMPGQIVSTAELHNGELHLPAERWLKLANPAQLNAHYQPAMRTAAESRIVGDMRIRFRMALPCDVSLIARQTGDSFRPSTTPAGEVSLVKVGLHEPADMFQEARDENRLATWAGRFAGLFCTHLGCLGIMLGFSSLSLLVGVIDPLRTYTAALLGTGGAILLSTAIVVVTWAKVDLLFTLVVSAIALSCLAGICYLLFTSRRREVDILQAELVTK